MTSTPSNDIVNERSLPTIILHLMEQGFMSSDAQIKELLTDLKYPENIYALKYILEHKGNSVSVEMLETAVKSLCSQVFDEVFSEETTIKLEWQLRLIVTILELMCQKNCQFTRSFIDNIKPAIPKYKKVHSTITQHEGETWKPKFSESNESVKTIKGFKCNYNNRYLLKLIKNTLNTVRDDNNLYQSNMDRAVTALKGLLVVVPGLAKVGIKYHTGVEVSLYGFDLEKSWKYLAEAFHVESSGEQWYATWRDLIILQDSLDRWCEQNSAISTSFKERVLLEYLWYQVSLCYDESAVNNQDVSDELWFGILDIVQQLVQRTFSATTQAICYYIALDSLNKATTEFVQFKSIEVLLNLEAKNSKLFVTTPDDIADCNEEYLPKLVSMFIYLKKKLEIESNMISKYSPGQRLSSAQSEEQEDKGKGTSVEKHAIDYITEDLTCAITCEAVGDFYQLSCQHIISSKALSSLNNLDCPYCRSGIRKDNIYYLPQQTIFNNVQQYITDTSYQDVCIINTGSSTNTDTKIFDQHDDLKKEKRKNRRKIRQTYLSSILKSLTTPNINSLFQKAETAYKKKNLDKALKKYSQILETDPTNYQALCNRAKVKLDMKNFRKALLDIETAIEVNRIYDDAWYLSLVAHVSLEKKKEAEQDIGHIKRLDSQNEAAMIMINELVDMDMEWFKILVDGSPVVVMNLSNDVEQWKLLCNDQYGVDDYAKWCNTAITWYNKHNNAPLNHMKTIMFYEKVYYMHKSCLKAHFIFESHIKYLDIKKCHGFIGYLRCCGSNKVKIPLFRIPPNKYKLSILLRNWKPTTTFVITIKTSTQEIKGNIDIEYKGYDAEYILPDTVDISFEDDVYVELAISDNSDLYLCWVCLYPEEKLDDMERNLKFETFSTGVKMIKYRQYRCPGRYNIYY